MKLADILHDALIKASKHLILTSQEKRVIGSLKTWLANSNQNNTPALDIIGGFRASLKTIVEHKDQYAGIIDDLMIGLIKCKLFFLGNILEKTIDPSSQDQINNFIKQKKYLDVDGLLYDHFRKNKLLDNNLSLEEINTILFSPNIDDFLPAEIMTKIFTFLEPKSLSQAKGVSSYWASLINSNQDLRKKSFPPKIITAKVAMISLNSNAGTSSLLQRFLTDKYDELLSHTFGFELAKIKIKNNILNFWDIADQPRFWETNLRYYKNSNLLVLCVDGNRREAMDNKKIEDLSGDTFCGEIVPKILVCTKIDLRSTNPNFMTKAQGLALAEKLQACKYLECSAKTGEGVKEVLQELRSVCNAEFGKKTTENIVEENVNKNQNIKCNVM